MSILDAVQRQRTESTGKTGAMIRLEKLLGEPIEVVLTRWYYEEERTLTEIGSVLDIGASTVLKWMRRLGIGPVRIPASEAHES